MKKYLLVIAAVAVLGCNQTQPTPVNVNVNVNNITTITLAQPVQSANPSCEPIGRLRIEAPSQLAVNTSGQVSLTPLTVEGKTREAKCDESDGASWVYNKAGFLLGSDTAFVTSITGKSAGEWTLTARVGAASGSVPVSVK